MKTLTVNLTTTFTSLLSLLQTAGYTGITPGDFAGTTKVNMWTATSDWQMQGSNDNSSLPVPMTQVIPFERVHDLLNLKLKATSASQLYIMVM